MTEPTWSCHQKHRLTRDGGVDGRDVGGEWEHCSTFDAPADPAA